MGHLEPAAPLTSSATADDVVAAMEAHGYAVVERLLPPEQVATTKAALEHVLAVLDQVLGHYQFSAPVGIQIGPGEPAQVLHHDDVVYPLPWPHAEAVVNSMWAFDDFTEANGATRIVPGSHRRAEGAYDPHQPTMPLTMPAGSVVFYPGTVLHGGGANTTDRPRLGVILEFVSAWIRPQENHVLGVPPAVVATLPERLQELLGYNVYPPFVGNVDGRHPRKYLPD